MPRRGVYKGGLTLVERVAELTMPEPNSGCWLWLGDLSSTGYGYLNGKRAHRISYAIHRKEIPHGLVLDHLCRNHPCVNPAHLEPVTEAENVRRGRAYRAKVALRLAQALESDVAELFFEELAG